MFFVICFFVGYSVLYIYRLSPQLTNITLSFNVKTFNYGRKAFTTVRHVLNVIKKGVTVPKTTLLKQQSFGNQINTAEIFMSVVLRQERLNFKKAILLKHLQITKLKLGTNTMHTCTVVVFKTSCTMNQHFLVSKYSLNLFTKVMRIALVMLHNNKIF